jgi:hypothetical protein
MPALLCVRDEVQEFARWRTNFIVAAFSIACEISVRSDKQA